jgi:hypothetical protein
MAGESKPRRRPSLTRTVNQARKAGIEPAVLIVKPDGTIVLHSTHNLGDNHVPAIPPEEEENEWDIALRRN